MADVITRLKVESTEYDSKIKRASQGLLQMEQACRKVGGTLAILEKDELEFVKGLGKMETVSKDARGQLNELTKAFTDLSLQYKRLTDEEKQGDFGKALASSLGELKTRIQDTKGQLAEVNSEINGGGGLTGALDQLAGKFGLNIQQLAGWGAAIGAAKVTLDVAKDAFFNSEEQLDEWGRTVESTKSIYNGFLDSLNHGDISGFLGRINQIIQAARDAYNALDELNTYNAFNQINVEKTRTGMTESIVDYREGSGSKEQVRAAGDAYKKELEERKKLEKKAYIEAVGKVAAERGVDKQDLIDALSGKYGDYKTLKNVMPTGKKAQVSFLAPGVAPSVSNVSVAVGREEKLGDALRRLNDTELDSLQALGAQAEKTANEIAQVDKQLARVLNARSGSGGGGGGKSGSGAATTKDIGPLQEAQKKIADLTNEALTADDARLEVIKKEIAALQQEVAYYKEIEQIVTGKLPKLNITVGVIPEEIARNTQPAKPTLPTLDDYRIQAMMELDATNTKVDTETLHTLLKDALQNSIDTTSLDLTSIAEQIGEGINVPDEKWREILDKYNELRTAIGEEPIQIDFNTGKIATDGKKAEDTWKSAASAVQSVGSAFSQIEDPAAKVAGTLAQAIASVTLGYAQATTQAAKMGPWAWVAFAATGLAQMISTISTIKSVAHFAEGGIVGGNDYTDNTPIMVSSGELILNKAQQGNLASQLQEGNAGSAPGLPFVNGQNIFLGTNNYLKGSGQGQLVTTQMLRSKGINI